MAKPKAEKNVNKPEAGAVAQTSETALAQQAANNPLMTSAPDWLQAEMKDAKPKGFENVNTADILLPRLAIAQGTSPEFLDRELDVDLGDVFDNLSKQVLAKAGEPLQVIPIVMLKTRLMFEKPQPPSPIICRSADALKAQAKNGRTEADEPTDDCDKCVFQKWADEEKPKCTGFYNFLVILPQLNNAAYVASFKSTGVKTARRWISSMMATGAHMFAGKYELRTREESNGSNKWHGFDFKPLGWVSKDEYERARAQFKGLEGKTWAPVDEGLDAEVAAEANKNDPAGAPNRDDVAF